jgi:hypothetical protein
MNTLQKGKKPSSEYYAELLELYDADPEEIARYGEKLDEELDDLETVTAKIIQACDLLIAQQS